MTGEQARPKMLGPDSRFMEDLCKHACCGFLLHEDDAELLSRLENGAVVLAATGGRNVLDAGAAGAVDVVYERELFDRVLVTGIVWIS